mmetsp:Transcript_30331/g.43400  ORF Transcript_30331/g.43400 Transcript_30331/m.43400 type:complete len:518 (+) Transcript_30331:49-1602(+)
MFNNSEKATDEVRSCEEGSNNNQELDFSVDIIESESERQILQYRDVVINSVLTGNYALPTTISEGEEAGKHFALLEDIISEAKELFHDLHSDGRQPQELDDGFSSPSDPPLYPALGLSCSVVVLDNKFLPAPKPCEVFLEVLKATYSGPSSGPHRCSLVSGDGSVQAFEFEEPRDYWGFVEAVRRAVRGPEEVSWSGRGLYVCSPQPPGRLEGFLQAPRDFRGPAPLPCGLALRGPSLALTFDPPGRENLLIPLQALVALALTADLEAPKAFLLEVTLGAQGSEPLPPAPGPSFSVTHQGVSFQPQDLLRARVALPLTLKEFSGPGPEMCLQGRRLPLNISKLLDGGGADFFGPLQPQQLRLNEEVLQLLPAPGRARLVLLRATHLPGTRTPPAVYCTVQLVDRNGHRLPDSPECRTDTVKSFDPEWGLEMVLPLPPGAQQLQVLLWDRAGGVLRPPGLGKVCVALACFLAGTEAFLCLPIEEPSLGGELHLVTELLPARALRLGMALRVTSPGRSC